jgi:hypothetical protein
MSREIPRNKAAGRYFQLRFHKSFEGTSRPEVHGGLGRLAALLTRYARSIQRARCFKAKRLSSPFRFAIRPSSEPAR